MKILEVHYFCMIQKWLPMVTTVGAQSIVILRELLQKALMNIQVAFQTDRQTDR